ncbi:lipase maturation factor family protein [Hymenobacter negativus]|uniref:Lipase maturation factor family protein n=1 Tax=Hymenobacter negativus TaxID=2795026 RepID=A0ABS0Q4C1_9BACT|nr:MULTISPECIES: lipase maturation factor family protein [Bacteria]MBH8557193.1 lipase maturation factor family protein [Hymenobacter negativus]MBH8569485.1 lipase maturation factor family protein [Hymenobacter negativus]MBR7209221.1 lipase maturation factor family protein [Microvirga sp. STS02]
METEASTTPPEPTYWLTRFVILRLLGGLYAVAFLVAINQIVPLIGEHGLLPVGLFLKQASAVLGSAGAGFVRLPSIFWLGHSDTALLAAAWLGFGISCLVAAGFANALLLAVLWGLYLSFVHVGQEWYGYGWEIQLTETGFLAIFLCPLLDGRPFPKYAPPLPVIVLFRWLVVRVMLGAGLIKVRGDEIWRNSTALYYHFETQPIPGPLSRWFHFLPHGALRLGVWFNWLAELLAPFFAFGPRVARHTAGVVMVLFQLSIILSGNLSFLNWLTIVPALACFDDGFWARLLPRRLVRQAAAAAAQAEESRPMRTAAWVVTAVIALLSIRPALNMISPGQIMNTSFDPLDLVNTYGAFGTVGRERLNVVFEGTRDAIPSDSANWLPYPYKGLPVALDQRPPQIAPYQLRLDWQMWFAAMASPAEYPWTANLVSKLLHNDPDAVSLFARNPFPGQPPRYIRAVRYRYRFARPGNPQGQWWQRERVDMWLVPLSADDPRLAEFLRRSGWGP